MKILIISHTPMNMEDNNGRTLSTLFSQSEKGSVAQLFLREGQPNTEFCDRYFCITDFEIFNSIAKFRKPGSIRHNCEIDIAVDDKEETYGKYSRKGPIVRFLRDLMWGINTWRTRELKNWLIDFNPEVVFFYASDSVFSHKIARWVCKYLNCPMVIYWVDDFYLKLKNPRGIIDAVNQRRFKRIAKQNIKYSVNACITPAMADAYSKVFRKEFSVIYNTSTNSSYDSKLPSNPLRFTYLGNISLGRSDSLVKIGEVIELKKLPITLDVYSTERRPDILREIVNKQGVSFHGGVSYEKVKEIMKASDAVLHVEGFEKENVEFARYSLSTKIADSLSSNRCLVCFGPKEVASIDYLIREKCALVATNEEELVKLLCYVCENPSILEEKATAALKVANRNHNCIENGKRLLALLEKAAI